jgi:hypothetical protein
MTTLEASLKLIDWFSENDYFNFPKDLNKLLVIHENENDKFPVIAALKNLLEENIIAIEEDLNGDKIYFLNRKFEQMEQEIKINGALACNIADRINWFCQEVIKDESEICNPKEIKSRDLWNILHVLDFLKKSVDSKQEEE